MTPIGARVVVVSVLATTPWGGGCAANAPQVENRVERTEVVEHFRSPVRWGIPCDPNATDNLRRTMAWLAGIFTKKTLSGQTDRDGRQIPYVLGQTGQGPAIHGHDMMRFSGAITGKRPLPDHVDKHLLKADRVMLLYQWHWISPTKARELYKGFAQESTDFDLAAAMSDTTGDDYRALVRDIDVVANEFKKLAARGYVIFWRPLHEADRNYFWWARAGQQRAYKELWRLMYTRFTEVHQLHNIIWCFTGSPDWYPGDSMVDIIGNDTYELSPLSEVRADLWQRDRVLYGDRKMLALSENGATPDIEEVRRTGARWLFFNTWGDDLMNPRVNPIDDLKRTYNAQEVIVESTLKANGWRAVF